MPAAFGHLDTCYTAYSFGNDAHMLSVDCDVRRRRMMRNFGIRLFSCMLWTLRIDDWF